MKLWMIERSFHESYRANRTLELMPSHLRQLGYQIVRCDSHDCEQALVLHPTVKQGQF
jgi:hypothetical protein